MLALAAGCYALGKFMNPAQNAEPVRQQSQDMGVSNNFSSQSAPQPADPLQGLHNHLPLEALRGMSDQLRGWNPPERCLDSRVLDDIHVTIARSTSSMHGFFEHGSDAQKEVLLDLGNVGNLAYTLSALNRDGTAKFPEFREAFANMPILANMPEWTTFRAETLERAVQ